MKKVDLVLHLLLVGYFEDTVADGELVKERNWYMKESSLNQAHRNDGADGCSELQKLVLADSVVEVIERSAIFDIEPFQEVHDNDQMNAYTHQERLLPNFRVNQDQENGYLNNRKYPVILSLSIIIF